MAARQQQEQGRQTQRIQDQAQVPCRPPDPAHGGRRRRIGRDRETMQYAIAYAETGHLCLSTLHANNANHTLDRIINFFPDTARHQLLIDLSVNLKAVVSQRLMPDVNGKRLPAVEVLLLTSYVSDLIQKGEIHEIKEAMKQGVNRGMQTFDEALYRLYAAGRITYETAMDNADSRTDLGLRIRLNQPADTIPDVAGMELENMRSEGDKPAPVEFSGTFRTESPPKPGKP